MIVSIEDMKGCVQDWFSQVECFEDLSEVFYAVRSEADKQFVYMAKQIAKDEGVII